MQGYHGQGSCLRQAAKPSPINGTQSQFSCKKTIPLDMWDVKGNCAKGRSKEALQINRELDNIKAQIIKHYQHLSDREAFVTAEMVRNSYQGFGSEYETLLSAFDKDIANQKKRVGKDRAASTLWAMERSRKDVAEFIQSHYRRTDMSMLELTPEFIKDFVAYLSTERGLANGTIWQRCMWLKGVVLRAHYNGKIPRNPFATLALSKGMPIESVSRVLGHTNIVTTQIYAKITSQKLNNDLTMLGNKLNASFKNLKMA